MNLKFKVLNGGKLPTRAHREDAGFDLYSPINAVLCGGTTRIKLGIGVGHIIFVWCGVL